MNITSRLVRLERLTSRSGYITVSYSNGTKRKLDGGSCIDLALHRPDDIANFEGGPGVLADLLNELLKQ